MALRPCRECGKDVSTEAALCPHCGVANPARLMTPAAQGCLGCLGIVALLALIGMCADSGTTNRPGTSASATSTAAQSVGPGQEYHAKRTANVRSAPSARGDLVRTLQPGEAAWLAPSKTAGWLVAFRTRSSSDTLGFVAASAVDRGPAPDLLLMDYDWEASTQYSNPRIVGSVKNLTGRQLRYVQISWTLLDSQDREVGTAWTNHTNLGPDAVWRFEALVLEDAARKYRLAGLDWR